MYHHFIHSLWDINTLVIGYPNNLLKPKFNEKEK